MRTETNGKHVDVGHTDIMQYLDQPFLWSGLPEQRHLYCRQEET